LSTPIRTGSLQGSRKPTAIGRRNVPPVSMPTRNGGAQRWGAGAQTFSSFPDTDR